MEKEESEPIKKRIEENQLHLVFENDCYEESLNHAVWFGKKIPQKRKVN